MNGIDRLLLNACEQMVLLVDPVDLTIVIANDTAIRRLGYDEAHALVGRPVTDVESSLQDVFYWEEVRAGGGGEIEAQEGVYLCADGRTLAIRKSVRVLTHEGRRLLLIQAHDVAGQRQAEEHLADVLSQLRATLEATGNGILVIDWHGHIVNMNRLFSTMWALPADLLGAGNDQEILDFVADSVVDSDTCRRRLAEIVDTADVEDLFELNDGRIFASRSRPQYLGEQVVGRVFSFDDVTERKHVERQLRESRDQLEAKVAERTADLQAANTALRAEQARQEELIRKLAEAHTQLLQSEKMASIGQLAAGIAHEINNPVGFVGSNIGSLQRYVDNLLRLLDAYEDAAVQLPTDSRDRLAALRAEVDVAYLREDVHQLIAESADGVQRVRQIVQDLKNFSRASATEMEVADIEAGLDSTLNVVWNELKYKAEVVKEYGHVPAVRCIPSQLNQVFMNLLVNAAHAITGRGRITVRTGADAGEVWVEVEDTGGGIPPEHLDRIFDPFFTTKPVGQGTGLGLSLSYQIVRKHDGRIEVRSEVGKGSVFRVVIPRNEGGA